MIIGFIDALKQHKVVVMKTKAGIDIGNWTGENMVKAQLLPPKNIDCRNYDNIADIKYQLLMAKSFIIIGLETKDFAVELMLDLIFECAVLQKKIIVFMVEKPEKKLENILKNTDDIVCYDIKRADEKATALFGTITPESYRSAMTEMRRECTIESLDFNVLKSDNNNAVLRSFSDKSNVFNLKTKNDALRYVRCYDSQGLQNTFTRKELMRILNILKPYGKNIRFKMSMCKKRQVAHITNYLHLHNLL